MSVTQSEMRKYVDKANVGILERLETLEVQVARLSKPKPKSAGPVKPKSTWGKKAK